MATEGLLVRNRDYIRQLLPWMLVVSMVPVYWDETAGAIGACHVEIDQPLLDRMRAFADERPYNSNNQDFDSYKREYNAFGKVDLDRLANHMARQRERASVFSYLG